MFIIATGRGGVIKKENVERVGVHDFGCSHWGGGRRLRRTKVVFADGFTWFWEMQGLVDFVLTEGKRLV